MVSGRRGAVLCSALVAASVAGCGGGAAPQPTGVVNTGAGGTPVPLPTGMDCGSIPARTPTWLASVPADLPQPPNAELGQSSVEPNGLTLVRFATRTSLRQSVVFILCTLPKAGYVMGRGDAELTEADTPFQKGRLHGLYKVVSSSPERTDWLLAVQQDNSVPFTTGSVGPSAAPTSAPPPFG
jgi:hypothetical protein